MAFPAIRFGSRRGERGAATVEYGLIVALVATLAAGGAAAVGTELEETFERVCRTLDNVGGVACTRRNGGGNGRGNNGNGLGNGGSNGGNNPGGGNPGGGNPGGGNPGAGNPGGGNPGGGNPGAGNPGAGAGGGDL